MCGIFCAYNPDRLSIDSSRMNRALNTLSHRGPDDEGYFRDDKIFLGHRRLSILDLSSNGHQPMVSINNDVIIIFNGQLYNHNELSSHLAVKGYTFKSKCDTETLLNMYLEYGVGCFEKLQGMWAVIIWDLRKQHLIVSRDRFGIKPLFIQEANDGTIYFASEIKAILSVNKSSPKVDDLTLQRYITRGMLDHTENTFFAGIKQIQSATYCVWKNGTQITKEKFWNLPVPSRNNNNPAVIRDLFVEIVDSHLQSDVPVAATLSGGLDSTSIICALSKNLKKHDEVHAFSIRSKYVSDESSLIDQTIQETGISHNYFDIDDVEVIAYIDEMLIQMDEPIFSASHIFANMLRKYISKKGYKVLLIGDGGDEIFGGYPKVFPMYISALINQGKYFNAKSAIRGAVDLTGLNYKQQFNRLKLYRDSCIGARTYQEHTRGYDFIHQDFLYDDDTLFPEINYTQLDKIDGIGEHYYKELYDRFRIDIPNHLRCEDRNSMAYGIESRPVFLDHKIIEKAWSYPYEYSMEEGVNKNLFRNAMKGIVTESVRTHKKKYVRPGNNTRLVYNTLRDTIFSMLENKKYENQEMWSNNLANMYKNDLQDLNQHNAFPWLRFYIANRWLELKIYQ